MAAGYSWQEANRNSSTVKAWLTSGTVDERREKHEIWVRVLLAINYEQQATCRTDPGLQALVEKRFNEYERERLRTVGRDPKKLQAAEAAWRKAIADAQKYVVPNEFSEIIERNGGTP